MGGKRLNTKSFIEKAVEVHGDQFDYSLVNYKGTRIDIKIVCKVHGAFTKKPDRHLQGVGCPKCGMYTTRQFIEKAEEVHGRKYNYSEVVYTGTRNKIKIICPDHGAFEQDPTVHLRGHSCRKCHHHSLSDFLSRVEEVHGDKYNYNKVVFKGWRKKVCIVCAEHGEFWQGAHDHLRYGCSKCGDTKKSEANAMSVKEFVVRSSGVHSNFYLYDKVDYKNSSTKVTITCPKHGDYKATPTAHMRGGGACPTCTGHGVGRVQQKQVADFIESIGIPVEQENRKIIRPFELDIVCGKVAFEFNGLWCHSTKMKSKNYHANKTKLCEEAGIRLIHIWEDDWKNKRKLMESFISGVFIKGAIIYARKTELKHIDREVAVKFLQSNHLQGSPFSASFYLGLFLSDELVSVATFKYNQYYLELTRCCNLLDHRVVGSLGKFVKWAERSGVSNTIVSFCDIATFTGGSYEKVGFVADSIVKPDYKYIISNYRRDKRSYRRKSLVKFLGDKFNPNLSEVKNMENSGYHRIYDCGKVKYVIHVG